MTVISRRSLAALGVTAPLWLQTPAAQAATGAATGRPIDLGRFTPIGGIDQWIEIHGRHRDAPAILLLHGGPGDAFSPFANLFASWEQDFTVALWDQRGAGKTYSKLRDKTPNMEADQFVSDAVEAAEYVRKTLGKRRIILVGHSWGAALALRTGKRRPDLFCAVVATGQPANLLATLLSEERYARAVLEAKGDAAGLKALDEAVKLDPTDPKRRFATRKFIFQDEDWSYLKIEGKFTGPDPTPTTGPVADWVGGYNFTSNVLVPKLIEHDKTQHTDVIAEVGTDLPFNYVLIQGRDDLIGPTDLAKAYFDKVRAPSKAYEEIRGGHFAVLTNPEGFTAALRKDVLPLCRG